MKNKRIFLPIKPPASSQTRRQRRCNMQRKTLFILIPGIFFALSVLTGCQSKIVDNTRHLPLFEKEEPLLFFGSDSEKIGPGVYDSIWSYTVDWEHNVYIADRTNLRVDKFDAKGNYLFSFGGKTHPAVQFPGWIENIAVDEQQNLLAFSNAKRNFLLFSKDGGEFKEIAFQPGLNKSFIKKMKYDHSGNLSIQVYSKALGYRLLRYDPGTGDYTVIHGDNKRQRPSFKDLLPGFAFDAEDNIYILDSIDYRVFKYSGTGKLLRTFFKETKKNKIEKKDFNFLMSRSRIRKVPNFETDWKNLKGASRFFPDVFGIAVDRGRVYVWSSCLDAEKRYLLDVYDPDFKYLFTSSYYNVLGSDLGFILDGKFYLPNIGSENIELKESIGRFGFFNLPHKVEVFAIAKGL